MTDNLDLWCTVEKTDPAHTKPITGKSYKGTSPKPYYLIRKATEAFGPCGIGWGIQILEETMLEGAIVVSNDGHHFPEKIHSARVKLWYTWGAERGEVEQVGQTVFCGVRKNGKFPFTDEDAPKKSVTDALTKALSMLGFAGDIFIGRYDDNKYVNDLIEENHLQQECDDLMAIIAKCDMEGLKDLWQTQRIKSFRNGGSNPLWPQVETAKDGRKAELEAAHTHQPPEKDNPFMEAAE